MRRKDSKEKREKIKKLISLFLNSSGIIARIEVKNKRKNKYLVWCWIFAVITVLIVSLLYLNNNKVVAPSFNPRSKIKIDYFIRSLGAIDMQSENLLFPKINSFGNETELHLHFLGDPDSLSSINGLQEVKEDIIQICFQDSYPDLIDDFVLCRNKDTTKDWEDCASVNITPVKQCIQSNKGKDLLRNSFKYSKKAGISSSPTIFLNNKRILYYPKSDFFERSMCNIVNKSEVCSKLPEVNTVNLFIVNDKRCKNCDVSDYTKKLNQIFSDLKISQYDISEDKGKKIFEKTSSTYLPLFAFDTSLLDSEGYKQVSRYIEKRGEYYVLKIGSKFNPSKEICDNKIDDTGNGLIDCNDPDCKDSLICRKEIPNKLELYIMSDCPYGKEAVKVAKPIIDNFGSRIDFSIHYIASETNDKFTSLHGDYEAKEDMRQLCVIKHYPKRWFNYILCRSKEGIKNKDWKPCVETNSMSTSTIEECMDGTEGKNLLSEDIKRTNSLGISRSPTWMANNRYKFSGLNSESVKNQFCNYNYGLKGCENHLSENSNSLPNSCG